MYENIDNFITNKHKRPSSKSLDKDEIRYGQWLSQQMNNYINKESMLFDRKEKIEILINKYEKIFKSKEDIWNEIYNETNNFINIYKKRPRAFERHDKTLLNSLELKEKRMGQWLSQQIKFCNKNKLDQNKSKLIDILKINCV